MFFSSSSRYIRLSLRVWLCLSSGQDVTEQVAEVMMARYSETTAGEIRLVLAALVCIINEKRWDEDLDRCSALKDVRAGGQGIYFTRFRYGLKISFKKTN